MPISARDNTHFTFSGILPGGGISATPILQKPSAPTGGPVGAPVRATPVTIADVVGIGSRLPVGPVSAPSSPHDTNPATAPGGFFGFPTSGGSDDNNGDGDSNPPKVHGPGEIWDMAPGQTCADGYTPQQLDNGSWTCVPTDSFPGITIDAGAAPQPPADTSDNSDSELGSLIDLMKQGFSGGSDSGGGSGVVALPTGGVSSAPASKGMSLGNLFLLIAGVGGLTYWWYRKHKRGSGESAKKD